MKDSAKTLGLLLASAAAGVAIGLLLESDSATAARKKIMKTGRRLADTLRNSAGLPLSQHEKELRNHQEFLANLDQERGAMGMA